MVIGKAVWRVIALVVCLGLVAFGSTLGLTGKLLLQALEVPRMSEAQIVGIQTIVVLGGGVSNETTARVAYAAHLARSTGARVLAAGGRSYGKSGVVEAEAMAQMLEKDSGAQVGWVDRRSINTRENAARSFEILAPQGRIKIALVTSAWHMPRAAAAFRKAGFEVVAAPTDYVDGKLEMRDLLPTAGGFTQVRRAVGELLGLAWYKVRGAA